MNHHDLIPHLFRSEFQRIVAVLCKHFGLGFVDEAEDIASSTFLAALETWPYQGVPPSPVGWLHTVARNKAINDKRRKGLFDTKIAPALRNGILSQEAEDVIDLSETTIRDSQVRMIFSVCDPVLPAEVQVALALRILCGFSVDEIASAFLSTPVAISKRIQRGKERLRNGPGLDEDISPSLVNERSPAVMATLYLLFNEGYHASGGNDAIRRDLCEEAMRMTRLLLEGPWSDRMDARALYALFCFQCSRLEARSSASHDPVLLEDQDPAYWDAALITQGAWWMRSSAEGDEFSKYHLEAMIAWKHVQPASEVDKWRDILGLYDRLSALEDNPVVRLNRIYALARARGKEAAVMEMVSIDPLDDPFRHSLLAWLYEEKDPLKARSHLATALDKARNPADRSIIQRRMNALDAARDL